MALAHLAISTPMPLENTAEKAMAGMSVQAQKALLNLTISTDREAMAAWACRDQSCIAADYAGSSGNTPRFKPLGGGSTDMACVKKYNPSVSAALPDGPAQSIGMSTMLMQGINALWNVMIAVTGATDKGTFEGECANHILIFAKGTFEPGAYGVFVGPSFTSGLPSGWSTAGVSYDPSVPGDFCLGLPGGMVAKDMINQAAQKCPKSDIYLSGYSQGAMVVRNGLAYANQEAKSHVKGVVTFGDPFSGAPIKGWNGPIKTLCNSGDTVCGGNFEIAASHLSYGMDTSAGLGQMALLGMVGGSKLGGLLGGGGLGGLGGLFG